ncbi:uncharacterized protein STEHIDRAFT_168277 [Stereum hirsutum FP-91666 SS1]|uniref:uncharacterized protein n=1 Tax=Stereum hirsutum (strain FP-91666) TaxID=721885 RepID=UPI000440E5B9|nr:uncharacterized protein STEHIDRAFT_168277 [Stereum hirsutum FP-91666 SS1]EIM87566.1 hypothetical protein STEHIDRAFT_168277 [Stereum hirsutum FP-91666 SS1]
MKFTTTTLFSLAAYCAITSARPVAHSAKARDATNSTGAMVMNASNGTSMGALYFITNQPEGNFVVSADINSDGTLTLVQAITTNGRGQHGQSVGPDGLFSQGAVKASASGNIVAAVNPGSNTISAFTIDPSNPASITPLGSPVSSEGEFPMSLAINKAGNTVCALNGGAINGVSCYSVNSTLGLVAMPNTVRSLNLNQTTPATGPPGSASHIIFSEDGSNLIASVKGVPPTPGFLAVWDVAEDGSLSDQFVSVAPASGGLLPFSMTVIPGANAILATDAGVGFDIFDMSGGASNATDSTNGTSSNLSSVVPITGQGATCWSSFSQQTGNFYLTDIITSMVTEVNVSGNLTGSIVKQYPQTNGSATIDNDIATVNGKDFMYVLQPNATMISVLALNGPGQATNLQSVDISGPASQVGLAVDRNNLQGMTSFIKN